MPSRYALRSSGTLHTIPFATPRRRANSESSLLTPLPASDLGPGGLEVDGMKCNPVLASKTQADRPIGAAQPVEFPHIPGGIEDGEGTQQPFFTPGEQPKSVSTNAVRLVVPQSSIDDKGEWTAIVPKSKGRSVGIDPDEHKKEQLDPELTRVLAEVERSLTDVDRARILQREEAENKALDSDTLSS